MKPYAKLFKASGEIVDVRPAKGRFFSLQELQGFVGGYIQIVPTPGGRVLVCDEEGKFKGYPVNVAATQKYRPGDDQIVGDVLICDLTFMD
jgi:hypothetical protein